MQDTLWHCQHVEVVDTKSGKTWLFPCNAWLGSGPLPQLLKQQQQQQQCEPAKLLLPAANLDGLLRQLREQQELEQREQYKIAVYTSMQSPVQGTVGPGTGCQLLQPLFEHVCVEVAPFSCPQTHWLGVCDALA
jgi:hypothetical protein